MGKFAQGTYKPKNPKKYVGNKSPTYRSSWEHKVFMWLDESPSVVNWASEPIKIPYLHPVTGKVANYIPDLLISYIDVKGVKHTELIEIKPIKETLLEYAKTKKDKITLTVNINKWQQAEAWAKQRGIVFRVITEKDIFGIPKKK